MGLAMDHSRKANVSLVLGTSMNVQPAASLPDKALKNSGKLIIVNLQRTPYDGVATLKVYAKTDLFMTLLMKELGIPEFNTTYDHLEELKRQELDHERKQEAKKTKFVFSDCSCIVSWIDSSGCSTFSQQILIVSNPTNLKRYPTIGPFDIFPRFWSLNYEYFKFVFYNNSPVT